MALTADVIPMWTWVHFDGYNWIMYGKGHLDAREGRETRRGRPRASIERRATS